MADVSDPGGRLFLVTPSDTVDIPGGLSSMIYISVAGTLQVTDQSGAIVSLPSMIAGWHPIRARRVWSTNTTATGIVSMRQV